MQEGQLIDAAVNLTRALNRLADKSLPGKLAGIVKLHSGLAVGSALIPVPGADIAAGSANIWTMYVRINRELELPFADNLIKSLAAGIVTNLGTGAAAVVVVGSALKIIPGLGSLGGALVIGSTIYGLTLASGIIYMKALARFLNAKNAKQSNQEQLRAAVDEVIKDKDTVQQIFKTAQADYRKAKKNVEKCSVQGKSNATRLHSQGR